MKKLRETLCWIGICVPVMLVAQPLSVSPNQLNFGNVTELATDSLEVFVTNPSEDTVHVKGFRFYTTYGQPAFSTSASLLEIPPAATRSLWVRFHPRHNILHNSEMVLLTDSRYGNAAVDLKGQGVFSKAYYASTQNQEQEDLKVALKTLLAQNYTNLGYNTARDQMYMSLDNQYVNGQGATQNYLECVYTGFMATGYTSRSDAQNMGFDTEHTFPQGFFNSNDPMRSDLHHLYPTKSAANNSRGNLPFGVASQPYLETATNAPSLKGSNGVYEPRDFHKGRVARAMLYFVTRYQNYSNFLNTQESTLRQWHFDFLPDTIERTRNEGIFALQKNRNPFVDYPQFIERISSFVNTASASPVYALDTAATALHFGSYDLANGPIAATAQYVLVNQGNQPVSVVNFALSDTAFSFTGGSGNDTTLAPGEALHVKINFHSAKADTFNATFSYNTNVTGWNIVQVPVTAQVTQTTSLDPYDALMRNVLVYPNPTLDLVQIVIPQGSPEPFAYELYNDQGRAVLSGKILPTEAVTRISTGELPSGYYYLQIITPVWTYRYPVMHL